MSRLTLASGCLLLAACESVIGLGDLEFDRGGGGSAATGTTASSGSTSTTATTSSSSTSGGSGGAGGAGGYGGYGGYGGFAPTYADLVREDVPTAYWRLGEPAADLVALDDGGQHPGIYFDGDGEYVLGEPGAITGDTDTAVAFDNGGHMFVEDAAAFRFPGKSPLTIELWLKFDTSADLGHTPIRCYGGEPGSGWIMYADPASYYWKRYGTDGEGAPASQGAPSSPMPPDTETFQHIVITMDEEGYVTSYVNGTITVLDYLSPIDLGTHDGPLLLGLDAFNPEPPPIVMDEVAIYDHQLPPERVALHYQCGRFGVCE